MAAPRVVLFDIGGTLWSSPPEDAHALAYCYGRGRDALRRALATHLVRDGASLAAVRELLGHVRLSTTERYVSVSREDLRRAVSLLEGSGALRSREALCSHEPEAGAEET